MAMELENINLKKQFEALPDETHLQNLQLKTAHMKQWLEDVKEKLDMRTDRQTASEVRDRPGWSECGTIQQSRSEPAQQRLLDSPNLIDAVNGTSNQSTPFTRRNKVRLTIITLAFLGLLAGFLVLRKPLSKIPPHAVPENRKGPTLLAFPTSHPVGLAYYNNRWLSVDWMDGRIFELNPTTGLKLLQAFPNSFTTGLSAGNNCLWSTDAFNQRCYKHDPRTFAVLASFQTPGPSPSAVYWDGASLWLADKKTRRAYKYLNIQGNATALIHYQLLEAEPVGLWRRDDLLWVLDGAEKSVRRYRVDKELIPVDTLDISGWLTGKARAVALALTDSEIWILTENPCLLYRHNLTQIPWAANRTPEK